MIPGFNVTADYHEDKVTIRIGFYGSKTFTKGELEKFNPESILQGLFKTSYDADLTEKIKADILKNFDS